MRNQSACQEAMTEWMAMKDNVKVGQVYDSGGAFFVVTGIDFSTNMVFVTGDIINDDERKADVVLGRTIMLAQFHDLYLESVLDSHIWGAFYKSKLQQVSDTF